MTTEKKEPEQPAASAAESGGEKPKKRDSIKFWTGVTLLLLAGLFVGRILSDKYVPYTANARIEAYIIPMAARCGRKSLKSLNNIDVFVFGDTVGPEIFEFPFVYIPRRHTFESNNMKQPFSECFG